MKITAETAEQVIKRVNELRFKRFMLSARKAKTAAHEMNKLLRFLDIPIVARHGMTMVGQGIWFEAIDSRTIPKIPDGWEADDSDGR